MKKNQNTPIDDLEDAGKELETISKTLFHKIISWVKLHPLLTLLFSFLFSVASNLVSSWLWYYFKK
ncbi:MAG TPA: hypothetical protein DIC64_05275 [Alphaproteobacteria bacterium]|nr:hypothetical protein [Alphaproteobacteria bacterium]